MRHLFFAAVFLAAMSTCAYASDIWYKYHNAHAGFRIDFPQRSSEEQRLNSSDPAHPLYSYQLMAGLDDDGVAAINSIDLAQNGIPVSQYRNLSYQNKVFDSMIFPPAAHNNQIVTSNVRANVRGYPARDYILKSKDGRFITHQLMILEGSQLIVIIAGGHVANGIPSEYDRMVHSIEFDAR